MAKHHREWEHEEHGNRIAGATFWWTIGCAAAFLAAVLYFIFL
jgi:type VI protein secretion system component VasF